MLSDAAKLLRAARAGDDAKVKRLLKAKVDVDVNCTRAMPNGDTATGITALWAACGEGHLGVVRLLLKAKATVNLRDSMGTSALYYACEQNKQACARLLLEAKAMVDLAENGGCTPLSASAA